MAVGTNPKRRSKRDTARRMWTYGDLAALPDDQLRHERIDGGHFVSPSPNTAHQSISVNLLMSRPADSPARRLPWALNAPPAG